MTEAEDHLRMEIADDLRENGATLAEVDSGVAFADARLREIDASLVRLRHHHRLLNVVALLALAVLIAIAWNLLTG